MRSNSSIRSLWTFHVRKGVMVIPPTAPSTGWSMIYREWQHTTTNIHLQFWVDITNVIGNQWQRKKSLSRVKWQSRTTQLCSFPVWKCYMGRWRELFRITSTPSCPYSFFLTKLQATGQSTVHLFTSFKQMNYYIITSFKKTSTVKLNWRMAVNGGVE